MSLWSRKRGVCQQSTVRSTVHIILILLAIVQVASWMQDHLLSDQLAMSLAYDLVVAHASPKAVAREAAAELLPGLLALPLHHLQHVCGQLCALQPSGDVLAALPPALHRHIVAAMTQRWQTQDSTGAVRCHVKLSNEQATAFLAPTSLSGPYMPLKAQAALLLQAACCDDITDLRLCGLAGGPATAAPLCAALRQRTLTALELERTPVLEDLSSADMLCVALERLPQLRTLTLASCGPVATGAAPLLAQTLGAMQLTSLTFAGCTEYAPLSAVLGRRWLIEQADHVMPDAVAHSISATSALRRLTVAIERHTERSWGALRPLQRLTQLVALHVTFVSPTQFVVSDDYLQAISQLARLTELSLCATAAGCLFVERMPLGALTALHHLTLKCIMHPEQAGFPNDAADEDGHHLCGLQGIKHLLCLQTLYVSMHSGSNFQQPAPGDIVALANSVMALPALRDLTMKPLLSAWDDDGPVPEEVLGHACARLSALQRLHIYSVYGQSLTKPPAAGAPTMQNAPSQFSALTSLELRMSLRRRGLDDIVEVRNQLFAAVGRLQALRVLHVHSVKPVASRQQALEQQSLSELLRHVTQLAQLEDLTICNFFCDGMHDMAPIATLTALTKLSLRQLTGNARLLMNPICHLPQLQELEFSADSNISGHVASDLMETCHPFFVHDVLNANVPVCAELRSLAFHHIWRVEASALCKLLEWVGGSNVGVVRLHLEAGDEARRLVCTAFNLKHAGRKQVLLSVAAGH